MSKLYDTHNDSLTLKIGDEELITVESSPNEVPVTNDPDGVFRMFFTEFVDK